MDTSVRTDASGRRWRYVFPATRALLAAALLGGGVVMLATGFALNILPVGITGVLCFLPGAYASYHLLRAWRGDANGASAAAWLAVEELPDA